MNKIITPMGATVPPQISPSLGEIVKNAHFIIEKLLTEGEFEKIEKIESNLRYFINKKNNINNLKRELDRLEWQYVTMPTDREQERDFIQKIKKRSEDLANEKRHFEKVKKVLEDDGIIVYNIKQARAVLVLLKILKNKAKRMRGKKEIEIIKQLKNERKRKKNELENELFERALEKFKKGMKLDFYEFQILVQHGVIAQEK
jgi:uncharacterized coiled-coil DUF342 family protein